MKQNEKKAVLMEEGELKKIFNVCNDIFAITSHIVIK